MIDVEETLIVPRCAREAATMTEFRNVAEKAYMHHRDDPEVASMVGTVGSHVMFGGAVNDNDAVLFLFDFDEYGRAVASADEVEYPELPPLPYPAIAFECLQDATWRIGDVDTGEALLELQAALAVEHAEGELWTVYLLVRDLTGPTLPDGFRWYNLLGGVEEQEGYRPDRVLAGHVTPGRVVLWTWRPEAIVDGTDPLSDSSTMEVGDSRFGRMLRATVVEAVQLITARGVELDEVPVPRPARRRAHRGGYKVPVTRLVRIVGDRGGAGGGGGREYHHRWWVRGHWRHYESGRRTWVRAYVKGPAGAPWLARGPYVRAPEPAPESSSNLHARGLVRDGGQA